MIERLRRRAAGGDAGFTLVELVIAIVLVGVLTGAIAAATSTSLFASRSTSQKVRESNDAQLLSTFLVRDAQAAGGTDPATAQADATIGVSTTDAAGCGAPGTLVIRYSWSDRLIDRSKVAKVATYGFDATTHQLVRRACIAGTSQGDVVVGRQVASVVARCDGSTTCPNLPATTSLTVTETNAPANGPTPYSYTLTASVRAQAQTLPSTASATEAPLIALGSASGTCPSLNFGGSAQVTVSGDVIVNAPGCANPVNFQGNAEDDYVATSTNILSPAYNPPSLIDPFFGTPIPTGPTCDPALTNPALSGGRYQPGTYHRSFTVPTGTVVFDAGVYVFCGDVTVPSNAEVTGSGVLWYFKSGQFNTNGQATMTMSAATTGPYTNLLIWIDRSNPNTALTINGGNNLGSYNGILYAPSVDITLNGGAGTSTGGIIAKSISFSGTVCAHLGSMSSITVSGTLPAGTVGVPYSRALTATGGTAPYTFSATGLPAGLDISTAGVVTGTPTAPGTTTTTITVIDDRCNGAIASRTITIGGAAATVAVSSPAALANATVGQAYAATFTATGGTGPYTFTATGVPAGLVLATNGDLSGTPTATGTSTLSVTAVDALGATSAARDYPLTVGNLPTPLAIASPAALASGTTGAAYPSTTFTATGGTAPRTFTATGLPAGLSLSTAGVLTGTPTAAGPFPSVVVTVTDAVGLNANRAYTMTVNPAPAITPTTVTVKKNSDSWAPITIVSGGTPGYTWTATGLPAWAQLTAAGTLAPTATRTPNVNNGTFTFTASLTDAAGASAGPVVITINVTN